MAKIWSAEEKLFALDLSNSVVPTGAVLPFGGGSAPTYWLLCDGSAVSRTTYADLFAVIGTTYGVGDGSTTFNLPDLQGNIPVGKDGGTFNTLGGSGGAETHALATGEMPSHTHVLTSGTPDGIGVNVVQSANANRTSITPPSAGNGDAHNNLQPYLVLNYIIKL